ncbi:MAG: helix-turn-helix domain-containing protein [Gaiellaceae bacterium]
MNEPLLTARELGELLGFKPGTIVDWAERNELPHFKIGGRLRFRAAEVEAWLETKRAGTGGEAPATPHERPPKGVVSVTPATPK